MNIITPREYTKSVMHQIPDIENNMYEVIKNKLKIYDERLVKLEDQTEDKIGNRLTECCRFCEGLCLWILVINLCIKVFN